MSLGRLFREMKKKTKVLFSYTQWKIEGLCIDVKGDIRRNEVVKYNKRGKKEWMERETDVQNQHKKEGRNKIITVQILLTVFKRRTCDVRNL